MARISGVEHHPIFRHPEHCVNQIAARTLSTGEIVAVFNEERFPFHHDSGQTLITRSSDGGVSWTEPEVVLPWTDTTGNWDCGICELHDGSLIVNLTITAFFQRGVKPEQPSWRSDPWTKQWGDWTWAFKTQGWIGTFVLKSHDKGATWSDPVPCNVRPLKHAGCRVGCWQLPSGSLLMGLYGRIRGYGEEGEGETTRSALIRSDDGGSNWEYFSTLAYDPASIIDYEEPAIMRLKDGRLVCFMRTHVNPSGDAKNMVMTVSSDDGFSWTPPEWTNIWGYPADLVALADGRYLMVYGYRREPYGVRGIVSDDGLSWNAENEFVIREGGVPRKTNRIGAARNLDDESASGSSLAINPKNPGVFQHIGYPTVVQAQDGTIACCYHEWSDGDGTLQEVKCTRFKVE